MAENGALALGGNLRSSIVRKSGLMSSSASNSVPVSVASSSSIENAPAAFGDFSRWVDQFLSGSSTNVVEGEAMAWKRRQAMLQLIQTDPARALTLAAPFEWRRDLPPEITKFFEQQVDGRGELQVAVATDFNRNQTAVYRYATFVSETNGGTSRERFRAFVYGRRLTQRSKSNIPLHGIALEGRMAVSAEPLRRLAPDEALALAKERGQPVPKTCPVSGKPSNWRGQPIYAESGGGILRFCGEDHFQLVNRQWAMAESPSSGVTSGFSAFGESGTIGSASAVNDAWTHGPKNLLYIRVNFPDDLTVPISETDAYTVMDGVNDFYTSSSYDLTSITTTVTPVVTVPQKKAWYASDAAGPAALLDDAREAARRAGYDTSNFDRDIIAFTSVPGFDFDGLAYMGGKGVCLQSYGIGVTSHELGHNWGLWHANFWDATTNLSSVGPGTNLEYGNIYDTMGNAAAGNYQFNAMHKTILDWLKADAVPRVSSNGVYRIYAFDTDARVNGRDYALVIRRDALRDYWLSFRDKLSGNPWTQNGLLINWSPWPESGGATHLVDSTPGSPDPGDALSRDDAAVVIGRTFNDPVGGVHITPLSRGTTGTGVWIEAQINLGNYPGDEPPDLRVETDSTNVMPGEVVHFHATPWSPEGNTLAYAWSFDDLTFSTNNLPWISKSWNAPGDHVVRCVVSDMKGGEASVNTIVTVGAASGYRITGRVTDTNGVPLEGVLVSNGDPQKFVGGYTDSNGRYVIVGVTSNTMLLAAQFGRVFSLTTDWDNPIEMTNDASGVDFTGVPLPVVGVSFDTNAVVESDGTAHHLTLTRTGSTNDDLEVELYVSGTATPGDDYTLDGLISGTNAVTIPAGLSNVVFTFTAVNNSLVEGDETMTVTVLDDNAHYAEPNYAVAGEVAAPPFSDEVFADPGIAEATMTILDDDMAARPTVVVATTTPVISENASDSGEFVFTRSGNRQGDLLVHYTVSGTARSGSDYTILPGVVLIPDGKSSTAVPFLPVDDANVESNKTVVVTLNAGATYSVGQDASAEVSILDDDFVTLTISASRTAIKPSTAGAFTVKRDGDLTGNLVVLFHVSGSAIPGSDYAALGGSVMIPAGTASVTIPVMPMMNDAVKGDVSVTVTLTNDINYSVGNPGAATVSIHDDHLPTVSVSAPVNSVSEQGDTAGQFTISRGNFTGGNLAVHLAISGTATPGADYLPLENTVVIPDGSSSVSLDVIAFHDLVQEPDEDVVLTVLPDTNYNVGSPANARVTISDDATSFTPGVGFCFSESSAVESESPGIAVGLSMVSPYVPITVDYRVVGGTASSSRYSLPAGTLTIEPSNSVAFIPLKIVDDNIVEPPQTIQVVLFNPINATLDGIKVHTYTILDDDANAVSIAATAPVAQEGGAPGNFRITRTGPTSASLPVCFEVTGTASSPTDYAPLGNSATIPAGASFLDLPVVAMENGTVELPQTVVVTLISAPGAAIVPPSRAMVTIADVDSNQLPLVSVSSTNHPHAVEGGANGEFLFTRSGNTSFAQPVSFTISGTAVNGTDYVAIPNSVIIPAGQTSVSLPVIAVDDSQVEGERTTTVTLTDNGTYQVAKPPAATVTIQDNDQRVWIEASDFYSSKYGPDPGEFTFSRFGTTNSAVQISFAIGGTASNGLDYVAISNSFVIPAGSLSATLPVLPLHNGIVEGPVTVTLTLQNDAAYQLGTPAQATVTVDDDMPMLTVSALPARVVEGSRSNAAFRLTRTGDPKYDFTAHLVVGGTATFGVDYPPFPTNVYFSCGVTAVDLEVSPVNEMQVEGNETAVVALVPDPAYTILSPSNATMTILDVGTDRTPFVLITRPREQTIFLTRTNRGLVFKASVLDDGPDTLSWTEENGVSGARIDSTNTADTTILFTNAGVYRVRLTADDGLLQSYDERTVVVGSQVLVPSARLYWPFEEGGGTNVHDTTGSGHDGVLVGSPVWTTGANGLGLDFAGTNNFVRQTSGGNVLDGRHAFTLALWIKPSGSNLDQGIFTASTASGATLSLATRSVASCGNFTNVIEATIATTRGVVHRISASNAALGDQWKSVVLSWARGEPPALYINGQLDQPGSQWTALSGALTNCEDFIVGRGPVDVPDSWNGVIDEVALFPQALGSNDVLSIAGACANCLGNAAPEVDAGTNFTIQTGVPVELAGSASDDGLPDPPATLTTTWELVDTNYSVEIPDPSSLRNEVTFAEPGSYTFRLTADDGDIAVFAEVTATVIWPTRVDIYASDPDAYELGPDPGEFVLYRDSAADTVPLTVYLQLGGTASNSVDYVTLTNAVTFDPGVDYLTLQVMPFLDAEIEGDQSVTYTIVSNLAYYISNPDATVTIHDSPYGQWSIQFFTLEQLTHPEITGARADFDHDGYGNFVEYALNLNPMLPQTNAPVLTDLEIDPADGKEHLTLTYTRWLPPTDVAYGVFVANDLLHWHTGSNYVEEFSTVNDTNGLTQTVKARAKVPFTTGTNQFISLRVWLEQVPGP